MSITPEGFSALTSSLIVENAEATIESYQKALGATLKGILNCPKTGKVVHACLELNGSTLFVYDACPERNMNATGKQNFYLYVENADDAAEKAKSAGFAEAAPADDMFWGDRVAILIDHNGNQWMLANKVRDVSPEEMQEAIKQMAEAA